MRTVQMTLDERLISDVDEIVKELHTSRSAFTRDALRRAVQQYREAELEARHSEGYRKAPVAADEFTIADEDRVWGDDW